MPTEEPVIARIEAEGMVRVFGGTFAIRNRLKLHGARWDRNRRSWYMSLPAAVECGLPIWRLVRVAPHCCFGQGETVYASPEEYEKGEVVMGCGLCDTPKSCGKPVKILYPDADAGGESNRYSFG